MADWKNFTKLFSKSLLILHSNTKVSLSNYSNTLLFLFHVHCNLHDEIEIGVVVYNLAELCTAASIAGCRAGLTGMVQVAGVAHIVSDSIISFPTKLI